MLVSCASIQGISWLEAAGAIHAENEVLRLIADRWAAPLGRRLLRLRRFGRQGEVVARFAFLHPNTPMRLVTEILDRMA